MLMTIRDKAQGWIAWAIVILISIPFALWGIQEYLGVGSEPVMAKVNDIEITEREVERSAFQLRSQLRENLGASYDADMFPESMLRNQVLEQRIQELLVEQAAAELGLRAGDAMVRQTIMSIPAFQVDGQFNPDVYRRAVQLRGTTEQGFEEQIRSSLVVTQLQQSVQGSSFVTADFTVDAGRLAQQKRKIAYLLLNEAQLSQKPAVDEGEIKSFYEQNRDQFMSEEMVKLEYLLLSLDTIANTIEANDSELREFYADHRSEFDVADKKRISHILFEFPLDVADDEKQQIIARAEDARARLEQGENFAQLAEELSDDIGSASQGGDLGYLEAGFFDKAFENAAVALSLNEVSQPVITRFGVHLIKVTELQKGSDADFDSLKAEIEKRYLETQASQMFFDYAERLGILSYESPDSLVPAAEELGLQIIESDWITRDGGEGPLASPKVTGAAFSEEALSQGFNSEPLELSNNELLVLRVVQHREPALTPLDQVRAEIEQRLQNRTIREALQVEAEKLLGELKQGTSLISIADSYAVSLQQPAAIGRGDKTIAPEIVDTAFSMPRDSDRLPVYASRLLADSVALIELREVIDGELGGQQQALADILSEQQGSAEFRLLIESLREKADIEIYNKAL